MYVRGFFSRSVIRPSSRAAAEAAEPRAAVSERRGAEDDAGRSMMRVGADDRHDPTSGVDRPDVRRRLRPVADDGWRTRPPPCRRPPRVVRPGGDGVVQRHRAAKRRRNEGGRFTCCFWCATPAVLWWRHSQASEVYGDGEDRCRGGASTRRFLVAPVRRRLSPLGLRIDLRAPLEDRALSSDTAHVSSCQFPIAFGRSSDRAGGRLDASLCSFDSPKLR